MPEGDLPIPEDATVGEQISTESSLSNWAGDYVTDMLGRGWAMADAPYEAYGGELTAGPSDLQDQAFGGIAGLTLPGDYGTVGEYGKEIYQNAGEAGQYDPLSVNPADDYQAGNISTEMWNDQYADQYMSPYIQQALDPQLAEIARQSDIQRLEDTSRLTQAGAYGGSRQGIMESEMNDNMLRLMAELTGKGYQDAYQSAGNMFTSDYGRDLQAQIANESARQYGAGLDMEGARLMEQSNQFGAGLGLDALQKQLSAAGLLNTNANSALSAQRDIYGDQLDAGAIERGITAEGIAADKAQFEQERDFPYQQVQYMHSLLGGMPLATQNYSYGQPSTWSDMMSGAGGLQELWTKLFPPTDGLSDADVDAALGADQYDFS